MSTSALLSLGVRAMFANQAALQTIGQNIANANVAGYSRQEVVLTTPEGQFTGAGYFGKGVNVQTVTRSHNEFLTREAAAAKSQAFMDNTMQAQLSQLENVFPTGSDGIGQASNDFLNALVDVASRPSDPSARQVVLGKAQELAARFQSAGQQLADLQSGVVSDMKADVKTVNELAKQIAAANDQIARANGTSHSPNDLLDKRDQLVSQLSQYVQVSTVASSDGTVGVFIGGGQRLVLGSQAQELQVTPDPYDNSRAQLSITEANGTRVLDDSTLTGGSLTALLRYQNTHLQDARNLLGQMATAIATRVNEQQALGVDLKASAGGPLFSIAPPTVMPAITNKGDAKLSATITDGSLVPALSFVISADPTGTPDSYQVAVRPDGTATTMNKDQIEKAYGISLTMTGTMQANDRFVLEPVAAASTSFKRALDDPSGLAAAAPVVGTVDVNNKGTATVDSLYAVNPKFDKSLQPSTVQFGTVNADQSINYTITLADNTSYTGTWKAGQAIGNDPANNVDLGFELRLNGVPREGDKINLQPSDAVVSTNNGNAKAFLKLQSDTFVGKQLQADGTLSRGQTVTEAYAAAIADVGSRVQGAEYLASVSTTVASQAEATRSGQAGVNLDEEAARLMQFQQGYQAAAKVLQTAQTIFDQLLSIVQR
ncbi:flagellar hook-associated protein FlgK [Roseateles depolymerans]|uniref:Flagellar hook-associated protein 1 n=1 Tax=Roseateles depolymerans TaxID=76731 RepID=A0A0U3LDS7_9BURK|nr:flagellar hook-associated protein FlgK [Roseateles depolymerans]ALV06255.1 Flagellar hook-associated protein 1 [Roseateles depolymerans]REG19225.1 flagellar hook-associated protein 1 FlgK [Roseateles depolymerans]